MPTGEGNTMKTKCERTSRQSYLLFIERLRKATKVCDSCHHSPRQLGQRLYPHHLQRFCTFVDNDPARDDPANILMLCAACHSNFHPGLRSYAAKDWQQAGGKRGRAL
jgi:hypothetical protein